MLARSTRLKAHRCSRRCREGMFRSEDIQPFTILVVFHGILVIHCNMGDMLGRSFEVSQERTPLVVTLVLPGRELLAQGVEYRYAHFRMAFPYPAISVCGDHLTSWGDKSCCPQALVYFLCRHAWYEGTAVVLNISSAETKACRLDV